MLPNGGGDGKAFECLTVENSRQFNESTPDVPDVRYYSWGAVYEPGLIDTWKYVSRMVSPPFLLTLVQVATFCDRRERRSQ